MSMSLNAGTKIKKLIGVFSMRAKAEAALAHVQEQPGIRECPEGFIIATAQIDPDQLGWSEGFVTIIGPTP
jgi:hypothetical protein